MSRIVLKHQKNTMNKYERFLHKILWPREVLFVNGRASFLSADSLLQQRFTMSPNGYPAFEAIYKCQRAADKTDIVLQLEYDFTVGRGTM